MRKALRRNWCKRAYHLNARFLKWWFPSISNDLRKVPSHRWDVLNVEERIRSPQSRASSGSHRTSHAKSRPKFMASVGRPQEKRTGMWLEKRETDETKDAEPYSYMWTGHRLSQSLSYQILWRAGEIRRGSLHRLRGKSTDCWLARPGERSPGRFLVACGFLFRLELSLFSFAFSQAGLAMKTTVTIF